MKKKFVALVFLMLVLLPFHLSYADENIWKYELNLEDVSGKNYNEEDYFYDTSGNKYVKVGDTYLREGYDYEKAYQEDLEKDPELRYKVLYEGFTGDLSYEDGAMPYVYTEEDLRKIEEKDRMARELCERERAFRSNINSISRVGSVKLEVEPLKQERDYWCGPATVQIVAKYLTGHPSNQSDYANWLGTTNQGTDFSRVANYLINNVNRAYVLGSSDIGLNAWAERVYSSLRSNLPVVLDIRVNEKDEQGGLPYRTDGHIIPIKYIDSNYIMFADPHYKYCGDNTVFLSKAYEYNNNHPRREMIY